MRIASPDPPGTRPEPGREPPWIWPATGSPEARQRLAGLVIRLAAAEPRRWRPQDDGECGGRPTRRAEFDDPGGKTRTLHLDPATSRARCLEFTFETHDGEPVAVTVHYRDWREVDDIPLPQAVLMKGSIVDGRQQLVHASVNLPVDDWLTPLELPLEATPADPGFRVDRLGEGVWVIGEGVFRQLFVEIGDFVVAYDGLGGDVNRRLGALGNAPAASPCVTSC